LAKKILIVEDDFEIAEAVQSVLESEKYVVVCAENALTAGTFMDDSSLDLVLLDIKLPDGDGVILLRELRAAQPSLPIIMMTGADDLKQAVECMKAGAQDYLRKPFARQEILEAVSYELSRGMAIRQAGGIQSFEEEERRIIENALEATNWRVNEAAQRLKIGRATIYRKIERFGLSRPSSGSDNKS
jgi:DNA-binding NtrC family response regulator